MKTLRITLKEILNLQNGFCEECPEEESDFDPDEPEADRRLRHDQSTLESQRR